MACPNAFVTLYLRDLLKTLETAAKMSLIQQYQDDEEMLEFLSRLREAIAHCYTAIAQGIKSSTSTDILKEYSE